MEGFLHTKNDSLSDAVINQGYEILCGIGTITQIVSQRAEKVYGIELVEEAIEAGYKVERMRLVDMFPNTPHVECVILMQRSGLKDEK